MEDRPGGRVNVVPADIAGVRRATGYAVMLRDLAAKLAFDAFGVQILPQPFQTGGIVGKLGFKVPDRVANCFAFNVIPELLVCHESSISQ